MWGEGREKGNRERAIIHCYKAFHTKKMDYIISLNWLMDGQGFAESRRAKKYGSMQVTQLYTAFINSTNTCSVKPRLRSPLPTRKDKLSR